MKNRPIWDRLNVDQLLTEFVAWLPLLFSALLIVVAFWILHRITRPTLLRILTRANLDPALSQMIEKVYGFTLMIFGVLMAVNQLGVNVGAALAGLGVVGLTLGFAAKDALTNIISGFLIFWDKPFRAGDWVTVGDHYGRVVEITMRTTRLLTWNNTTVIIPNETAINQVMTNHSAFDKLRIEVPISAVTLNGDFSSKEHEILEAVRKTPDVLETPPPAVVVKAISGPSLDLIIYAWVAKAEDERPVFSRILEEAKTALFDNPRSASPT
jgi:small conductance mechanosensitive channel